VAQVGNHKLKAVKDSNSHFCSWF